MQSFASNEYVKADGLRLDVLKFVLAIFIVGIHTQLTQVLQPIFRLGVPIFFVMTSYFFFLKQSRLASRQEKMAAMKKYALRILRLYLFWFVVLLPLTVYFREWYVDPGVGTLLEIVRHFIFGSTFKASWFLMASLLGIWIVWCLSDKVSTGWLVAVSLICYVICCLSSNYYYLCQGLPGFTRAYEAYESVFTHPFNSFPVALIFVLAGKYLAEHPVKVSNRYLLVIVILGLVALYAEYLLLDRRQVVCDDCYFSLLPLGVALFMLVGQNHVAVGQGAIVLRRYSTVMFCVHASLIPFVKGGIKHLFWYAGCTSGNAIALAAAVVTIMVCVVLARVLLRMAQHEKFAFVRYAY